MNVRGADYKMVIIDNLGVVSRTDYWNLQLMLNESKRIRASKLGKLRKLILQRGKYILKEYTYDYPDIDKKLPWEDLEIQFLRVAMQDLSPLVVHRLKSKSDWFRTQADVDGYLVSKDVVKELAEHATDDELITEYNKLDVLLKPSGYVMLYDRTSK